MELGEDGKDIESFLAGDREAFDRLVLRHKDRVFNLCYRLLGDYGDADDCAQESFIRVYRSLKGFRFASTFSTWLYTIAVNTCRNKRKSAELRFWRRVLPFKKSSDEEGNLPDCDLEDPAPSALDLLTAREQDLMLQAAIDSLSLDHRTVIVLRHVEGLSYEEICQVTGYNPGTLKSKLARARLQLHNRLHGAL